MPRVGAPAISPDGRWVVVGVIEPAYDEKQQASDLWMVRADGSSAPRRLTSAPGAESGVAWSLDSTRVAFSARRGNDEVPKLYVLDVAHGGEAQRVTSVSTGARAPRWNPDGTALLFTSDVYPGARTDADNKAAAAERKARKYSARVFDAFPVRDFDRWLDDRQASLLVQPLADGAEAKDLLAESALVHTTRLLGSDRDWHGEHRSRVDPGRVRRRVCRHDQSATRPRAPKRRHHSGWFPPRAESPDGSRRGPKSYGSPVFAPDGRSLYTLMEPESDRVYTLSRLARWSWPAMTDRQVLGASLDAADRHVRVSGDSARLSFTADDRGHERLTCCPPPGARHRGRRPRGGTLSAWILGGPSSLRWRCASGRAPCSRRRWCVVRPGVRRAHAADSIHGGARRRARPAHGRDILVRERARRAPSTICWSARQASIAGEKSRRPARRDARRPHGASARRVGPALEYHLLGALGESWCC